MQLIQLCILSLIGLASAAPQVNKRAAAGRGTSTTVKLVNNCKTTVQVGKLGTGITEGPLSPLRAGKSISHTYHGAFSGRFWARNSCTGNNCAAAPNSLAEFTFFGGSDGGLDFYDVSFVDGYNLPISITPHNPVGGKSGDKYHCGTPQCKKLPACPKELQLLDDKGKEISCLSACSKFKTNAFCCAGPNNAPDTCPINSYASKVKKACPTVYTYAYDDHTSTFTCSAPTYTVTWCP